MTGVSMIVYAGAQQSIHVYC